MKKIINLPAKKNRSVRQQINRATLGKTLVKELYAQLK
jgi:hypothetical protein